MLSYRNCFAGLARLKSPWYYWYRGQKRVALAGMGLGLAATGVFVALTAGIGLLPLALALAFDHLVIVLAVLYVLVRLSLPAYLPLDWIDWLMVSQVLAVAVPGILITRACTLCVAALAQQRARKALPPLALGPSCAYSRGSRQAPWERPADRPAPKAQHRPESLRQKDRGD